MKAETIKKITPRLALLPAGLTLGNPNVLIATWFGSGLCRPAPGTIGSIAAIPPGMAISYFFGPLGLFFAALLILWAGIRASDYYVSKSGEQDAPSIVVDEVAGLWIAAIPAETNLGLWVSAFILFRFFDIYKPWPASYFDRRKRGGLDVMLDDVVAGCFAFVGVAASAFTVFI